MNFIATYDVRAETGAELKLQLKRRHWKDCVSTRQGRGRRLPNSTVIIRDVADLRTAKASWNEAVAATQLALHVHSDIVDKVWIVPAGQSRFIASNEDCDDF